MDPQRVTMLNRVALGVAAAVRFAGLLAVGRTPYVDAPLVDAYTYWDQAGKLLAGDAPFKEGFYQPPGYPVVLAAFGRLTGGLDFQTARAFNLLCGLVTTALLIHLGRRLGERSAAPWMGAVAGLIYTLYPTTLLFELDLLTPALSNVLLIGAVALLWTDDEPSTARAGGAGLLAGIACVVHPTYLIAAVALGLWLLVRGGASAGGLKRQAIALAVGLGLALAPTTLTNLSRFGHLTLVSHNSGVNFYLGNNPDWRETAFLRPGLLFRKLVLEAEPAERGPFERNAYWWDRSWAEIGEAPDAWLATLFTKSLWSVNNREIPRNEDYRCRTRAGPVAWIRLLPLRYGLALPFALAGAVLAWRRRRRGLVTGWVGLHATLILFLVGDSEESLSIHTAAKIIRVIETADAVGFAVEFSEDVSELARELIRAATPRPPPLPPRG